MNIVSLSVENRNQASIEERFGRALTFFEKRGGVLFLSRERFWDKHGFVQQSLATTLAQRGIPVLWLDGMGWKPYKPTFSEKSSHLSVKQIPTLPGRRIGPIDFVSRKLDAFHVRHAYKRLGNPVVWIEENIDSYLAEALPNIDVFSVFDDPHHLPKEVLGRASLIVTQNSFAKELIGEPKKTRVALPPMEITGRTFDIVPPFRTAFDFPERVMGCVGSLMAPDFDVSLLEFLVATQKDIGFIAAGRTNSESQHRIDTLKAYKNFIYVPWQPRKKASALWQRLQVSLLLYGDYPKQEGGFPTRALEAFYFGIPCVATDIAKTHDLNDLVFRSNDPAIIIEKARELLETQKEIIKAKYERLAYRMNPKLHLARVAEFLEGKDATDW